MLSDELTSLIQESLGASALSPGAGEAQACEEGAGPLRAAAQRARARESPHRAPRWRWRSELGHLEAHLSGASLKVGVSYGGLQPFAPQGQAPGCESPPDPGSRC